MMNEILNHDNCNNYDKEYNVFEARQKPLLRDHLKCGEVYIWRCAGELYAIECKLCEDHPLCPLSEFPQHMEVWHTEWEEQSSESGQDQQELLHTEDDEEEDHNIDYALSFTPQDSGLFVTRDQLQNVRMSNDDLLPNDSTLEPFEQVLIEQDHTIDSTQHKEDVKETEKKRLKDVNKQVAKAAATPAKGVKISEQLEINVNKNVTLENHKLKKYSLEITENERELRELQTITESENDLSENETKEKQILQNNKIFNKNKYHIKKILKKTKNSKSNLKKFTTIIDIETETSENKLSEDETSKPLENVQKSDKIIKTIMHNLKKIKEIKRNLQEILKKSTKLNQITETESETSANECSEEESIKSNENIQISRKATKRIKQNLRTSKEIKTDKRKFPGQVEDFSDFENIKQTESETSGHESELNGREEKFSKNIKIIRNYSNFKRNDLKNIKNSTKTKHNSRIKQLKNCKKLNETELRETSAIERETNETETSEEEFSEITKETSETEKEITNNRSNIKIIKSEPRIENSCKIKRYLKEKRENIRNINENEMKTKIKYNVTRIRENETNESEISENDSEVTEIERKQTENEKIKNGKAIIQEYETEMSENETETNIIHRNKNEIKRKLREYETMKINRIKRQENELEMNGNETNESEIRENENKVTENERELRERKNLYELLKKENEIKISKNETTKFGVNKNNRNKGEIERKIRENETKKTNKVKRQETEIAMSGNETSESEISENMKKIIEIKRKSCKNNKKTINALRIQQNESELRKNETNGNGIYENNRNETKIEGEINQNETSVINNSKNKLKSQFEIIKNENEAIESRGGTRENNKKIINALGIHANETEMSENETNETAKGENYKNANETESKIRENYTRKRNKIKRKGTEIEINGNKKEIGENEIEMSKNEINITEREASESENEAKEMLLSENKRESKETNEIGLELSGIERKTNKYETSTLKTNELVRNINIFHQINKNIMQKPERLRKSKRNNKNNEAEKNYIEIEDEIGEKETGSLKAIESIRKLDNSFQINQNISQNPNKVRKSKRNNKNKEIERNSSEIENETSENETNSLETIEPTRKLNNFSQINKTTVHKRMQNRKSPRNLKDCLKQITVENEIELKENETILNENKTELNDNETERKETIGENEFVIIKKETIKSNELELVEDETLIGIEKEILKDEERNMKNEKETEMEKKTIRKFNNSSQLNKKSLANTTNPRKSQRNLKDNVKEITAILENETMSENESELEENETLIEIETEIYKDEKQTKDNEMKASENEKENQTELRANKKLTKQNESELSDNETGTNEVTQNNKISINVTISPKYSTGTRKSLRNFKKNKINLQEKILEFNSCKETQNYKSNSRNLNRNQTVLKEEEPEEMKQRDVSESGTKHLELLSKLPTLSRIIEYNCHESSKSKATKRNLKEYTIEFEEEYLDDSESVHAKKDELYDEKDLEILEKPQNFSIAKCSRRVRRNIAKKNLRELEDKLKDLEGFRGGKKRKANVLDFEENIAGIDKSIESAAMNRTHQTISPKIRKSKRNLKNSESEMENLTLNLTKTFNQKLNFLKEPHKASPKFLQRKSSRNILKLATDTLKDSVNLAKRTRRESSEIVKELSTKASKSNMDNSPYSQMLSKRTRRASSPGTSETIKDNSIYNLQSNINSFNDSLTNTRRTRTEIFDKLPEVLEELSMQTLKSNVNYFEDPLTPAKITKRESSPEASEILEENSIKISEATEFSLINPEIKKRRNGKLRTYQEVKSQEEVPNKIPLIFEFSTESHKTNKNFKQQEDSLIEELYSNSLEFENSKNHISIIENISKTSKTNKRKSLKSEDQRKLEKDNVSPTETTKLDAENFVFNKTPDQTNSLLNPKRFKEGSTTNAKQTLVTQYFGNKNPKATLECTSVKEQSTISNENFDQNSNSCSTIEVTVSNVLDTFSVNSCPFTPSNLTSQNNSPNKDNSSPQTSTPSSPLSPKTEEEHFEFYEPKVKLNKHHISHLIKLYRDHPRLWDQSHPDFCEYKICRKSWQQITDQWNEFCKRKFTTAEVRVRISTLCQRYLEERERLQLEGELDEAAKFPYYEQMQFLEQQKSLQKRRELYEQQNEKLLEIYKLFPVLWHVSCYKLRQAKERAQAFESISKSLKLCSIHLSSMGVQKRIRSLRKCYRLEKIRFLHAQVEQTPFETEFRHYERMQFLDKHIDPFVCRICGKIFENLLCFREHLEVENHGNVLQEDSGSESEEEREEKENDVILSSEVKRHQYSSLLNEIANKQMQTIAENNHSSVCNSPIVMEIENPDDILQSFTPLTSTPIPELETNSNLNLEIIQNQQFSNFTSTSSPVLHPETNVNLKTVENNLNIIQEVLIFPPNTPAEPLINTEHMEEDHLIEEIMDTVTTNNSFTDQSLDQFINSATNYEEIPANNYLNNFAITLKNISNDSKENCTPTNKTLEIENSNFKQANELEELESLEQSQYKENSLENPSSSTPLVVKVQCADFSLDLNLNPEQSETCNPSPSVSDNEFYSSADINTIPLPDHQIHKMIELYRKYPQLWNPNHLDYNSRKLRRQAWCSLTAEFNTAVGKQFSWRTMHRKLTDYAKYYKKLITEQEDYEELENKWTFYEDFKFLDDVLVVHDELQRTVHHRDNNFKIIAIYETFPQLWNIKHPEYNKRSIKHCNFELMCNRLQEENNLQITTERLKNRLIELRAQYRLAKKQRLKCEKNEQTFSTDFEFYEALNFLDAHIDPFICECKIEFKKLTDYNHHMRKEHEKKTVSRKSSLFLMSHVAGEDKNLENICHICGIKFTTRSNLVHHIKRHEGIKNYECTICTKKFYASHPLKIHIRSHTKECPYTCEKCGMSFVSASKLNQHVKRHLDRKDFQCDYCPKAFYTGFEKDRHEKRHLNIREKVCPICGKTFVAGSSYYAHMMLHSDIKRFECDKCNMKFAQYAGLYKHKKRYHSY